MSTSERSVLSAIAAAALAACASLQTAPGKPPAFGAAVSAEEVARWDISIPPSGAGLPKGSGSARQGLQVYEQKCMSCHGAKGVGKPADVLVGGVGSLASRTPLRTVGSYWPYATTLFDYVRGLCGERLCALSERHRRRGRGHERADAAAGENAQPRRLRERLAAADEELRNSPAARSIKEDVWGNSRWERSCLPRSARSPMLNRSRSCCATATAAAPTTC